MIQIMLSSSSVLLPPVPVLKTLREKHLNSECSSTMTAWCHHFGYSKCYASWIELKISLVCIAAEPRRCLWSLSSIPSSVLLPCCYTCSCILEPTCRVLCLHLSKFSHADSAQCSSPGWSSEHDYSFNPVALWNWEACLLATSVLPVRPEMPQFCAVQCTGH